MLLDVLVLAFVVLTLGMAFAAIPLSGLLQGRGLGLRRMPRAARVDEAPAPTAEQGSARIIAFPGHGGTAKAAAANQDAETKAEVA